MRLLDYWGNKAEIINGLVGMAGNVIGAAGEVLGAGDAVQAIGLGLDYAAGAGLDAADSAEADIRFAQTVIGAENLKNEVVRSIRGFAATHPNTAEGIKAVVNAAAGYGAAKGVGAAKRTGMGKADVSMDFADSYAKNNRWPSMVDGEMFQGKNIDFKTSSIGTKIHDGAQGKHILGHNNYISGKSVLDKNVNPQELLNGIHSRIYPVVSKNNRGIAVVDFGKPIGVDQNSGLRTNFGSVHSGKKGVHIVPYNPNLIKKVR